MGYTAARGTMSNQSSHGTFRNSRRGGGSDTGFRILAGLVGVIVLLALIALATALLKLRDQVYEFQARPTDSSEPRVGADGEVDALRAEVAALQNELASRSTTATADRQAIKAALARLLHQHEADSGLVSALLEGVSDEVREEILNNLGGADPLAGHRAIRASLQRELDSGHGGNGSGEDDPSSQSEGPEEELPPIPPPVPPIPAEPEQPEESPAPGPEEEPEPGPEPPPSPNDSVIEYTVVAGDNLSKIARKHSVTMEAIVKANGIANPDLIEVGDVLKIPVAE